jgi:hypothetical protein
VPTETVASLVKFCTVETGLRILNSQSLRWSAPHLFGDPFELHHRSAVDFDAGALLDVLLREALIILFGPNAPTGRHNKLVNTMARWREEERFCDEQEAGTVLRELLGQIAELRFGQVQEYTAAWQRFARGARIACFAEKPGNLNCWQRFADNHRGLALRFDCGDGTALPRPRQVQYQNQAPVITSKQEQLNIIYERQRPPTAAEFLDKLLTKGRQDQAEQEWRCCEHEGGAEDTGEADDSFWYDNRKFPSHELRAVYFGANMAAADRLHIGRLLRANNPTAKLWQAVPASGRYELEFSPCGYR